MSDHNEYYKNEIVHSLAEALKRGGRALQNVPGLLARCIKEDLWVERDVNGRIVLYDRAEFRRFVEAPYPEGLDTTIDTIEVLCSREPEIMAFLANAKKNKPGRPPTAKGQTDARGRVIDVETFDIIKGLPATGTSKDYAYQRLSSESEGNPKVAELYGRVLAGDLSPNAAMVEAGFRPRRKAINMDDPSSAARTILNHMSPENIRLLIEELS